VGTLGRSALVDGLVASGKLDVTGVTGKWDTFVIQVSASVWPAFPTRPGPAIMARGEVPITMPYSSAGSVLGVVGVEGLATWRARVVRARRDMSSNTCRRARFEAALGRVRPIEGAGSRR